LSGRIFFFDLKNGKILGLKGVDDDLEK